MLNLIRRNILLTVFIIISLLTACSKMNPDAPVNVLGEHPEGWLNNEHAVSDNDDKDVPILLVCTECHGLDFKGGISKLSCYTCHSDAGAHPKEWLRGHVNSAEKEVSSCTRCHGSDYRGGDSSVSCYTCHNGPDGKEHEDGWEMKHAARAKQKEAICFDCHGENYKGGLVDIGCYKCHLGGEEGYPHPQAWGYKSTEIYSFHQTAFFRADSTCNFSFCHGEGLKGGEPTISWGEAPSCSTEDFSGRSCH